MSSTDKEHNKILFKTSWISTIGNLVLSIAKITIGLLSGSLAVVSDGIDSASDVVISVIMIFTASIVKRPPSKKYVYGYLKAESIATKILSLIIFYAGMQLFIISIQRVFSTEERVMPTAIAVYVTLFSIIAKIGLSVYQKKQGKNIKSSMLIANAVNMRNDVFISVGVLIGLCFTFLLGLPILDAFTGLIISLFIIKSAISIFIETNIELMDGVKDMTVYDKIFEAVERVKGAKNPHRVRSRYIGNKIIISLDIEADGGLTLYQAHEIADNVEKEIKKCIEDVYDIMIHVEPAGTRHSPEKFGIDPTM